MASVNATLKLFDAFTGPLQKITQSLNMTISAMQKMQNAAERNVRIDRTLLTAKKMLASAEAEIKRSIEQATAAQERFANSTKKAQNNANLLLSTIKRVAAAYLTFEGARRVGEQMLTGAMRQEEMLTTFIARTGNEALGRAIYDQIVRQALRYGQDVNAALKGAMSFMSMTMDPRQLAELNKLAMRLAKLNPAEGLEGAVFSLKELASGDYTSIAERFNISRSLLKDHPARRAGERGDIQAFIREMDKLLNQLNMTQKAFESMLDTPAAKWNRLVNTFRQNLSEAGQAGLKALEPLIDKLNSALESGRLQSFFNALSHGLTFAAYVLSLLVRGAWALWNVVSTYWPEITAILVTWAFAYLPTLIARLWAMIPPLYAQAVAWLATHWPILAAIAFVFALVLALHKLGVTAGQVIGFVVGAFYWLLAAVYNVIAGIWNGFLTFAQWYLNLWVAMINRSIQLFHWLAEAALKAFASMAQGAEGFANALVNVVVAAVNKVIGAINGLIDALNMIPGFNIGKVSPLGGVSISLGSKQIKGLASRLSKPPQLDKVDFSGWRLEYKSLSDAFAKGYKTGTQITKKVSTAMKNLFPGMPKDVMSQAAAAQKIPANLAKAAGAGGGGKGKDIDKVGKVGEVGKIRDTVDISSEDLRIMRELAEMRAIQNFVTLTPQINFGDMYVRQDGRSVEEIIAAIEEHLREKLASSVKGVFNVG